MFVRVTVILLSILSIEALASKTHLVIRDRVFVSDDEIRLIDLIKNNLIDPKLKKELQNIKLGNSPKNDEERVYTNIGISEVLRSLKSTAPLRFHIPKRVVISRSQKSKNINLLKKSVRYALIKVCPNCEISINEINLITNKSDLDLHSSIIKNLDFDPINRLPQNSFMLGGSVYTEKGKVRAWFKGEFSATAELVVTTRTLGIGERIQLADVRLEKRAVTFNKTPQYDLKEVIGRKISRGVQGNSIISDTDLAKEKIVQRGQIIQAFVDKGNWKIMIQAKAKGPGFIGDTIELQNIKTKRLFSGRVMPDGTVEVVGL